MSEPRPVHLVLTGNEAACTPVTDEEWDAIKARECDAAATRATAEAARQADLALLADRAAKDPAFAALARLIGLTLPEADPAHATG